MIPDSIQWGLLLTLGFFVLIAYRQLGYMLRLKDIGSERDGLPIGARAPAFDFTPLGGPSSHTGRFNPQGNWSVLLFADPGCASCHIAISSLEHLAPSLAKTKVFVATTADQALVEAVPEFASTSLSIYQVPKDVPNKAYRTLTTPFAYVIDPHGLVKAKGIVGEEAALRKLLRKVDWQDAAQVAILGA